jgi:hypothetical protein
MFPKACTSKSGSKYFSLFLLQRVQSPKIPGSSGAKSVGVAKRIRFLRCLSGKREAYIALIVPPWQYPKRVNPLEWDSIKTFSTALGM